MSKIKAILPLLLATLIFSACEQIEPDDYKQYVGTLYKTETGGYDFYIEIDGGTKVVSDDYEFLLSNYEDQQRIMFYYSKVKDYTGTEDIDKVVKIRDVTKVRVKELYHFTSESTEEERDSIGTEPVNISHAWLWGGYLNIEFTYYGSGINHNFDLVFDELNPVSTLDEIYIELKHNNKGDVNYAQYWDVCSFDISSLHIYGQDSINVRLEANGYNDYFYTAGFVYDFSDETE